MSIVLEAKVKRPVKTTISGKKVRLVPGDTFPHFDVDNKNHWYLVDNHALELVEVEGRERDLDNILARIEAIDGVGPKTMQAIREAVYGDSQR